MDKVVSIITPSFNRADIIDETAQSIFNQTYPHWEWMIVDDGSTDDSWSVIEKYAAADSRVKIFKRDRAPKGAACCRNIAVEKCTGDYVIFLDTDDLLASFCLEQRVKAAALAPASDFIIFPMLLFKQKADDMQVLWNIEKDEDEINRLLFGDPICQGTGTLWKKKSFVDIGMWDEKLLLWQDIELHLRSLLAGLTYTMRMDLLPDIFLRVSDVSLSRTGYNSLPKLKSRMQVVLTTMDKIIHQQLLGKYKKGLRNMTADIIISAINSNFFTEARQLIDVSTQHKIFERGEVSIFLKYMAGRKYKLYKIPFINKSITRSVYSVIPKPDNTLGTIKYLKPITI